MASSLEKVTLKVNKDYKPSGPKSYVYLLNKYKFSPTQDGPYFVGNKLETQGKHGDQKVVGGKTTIWSNELPKATLDRYKGQHSVYDPSKSSTFQRNKSTWKISYGDGSTASGDCGTDTVDLGGLKIEYQCIELAKQLSDSFASGPGDGLLGLAFGPINQVRPGPVKTPVENMIAQQDIPKDSELFTCYLSNHNHPADEPFFTFGYIDKDALEGQTPYYVTIDNSQGFWQFPSTTAIVAGKTIQRTNNTAIADTGTTLALMDDTLCQAIYKAIPGAKYDSFQQGYVFPSSTPVSKLPDVSFAVGGKQFSIHKEDLGFANAGNGMVYEGIQSRGTLPFDILGDTWLKGVYVIFDQGKKRMGVVQRKVFGS